MKLKPGDQIENKYRVLSTLGGGTFGTVYLAEDLFLNRKLAIKLLHRAAFRTDPLLLKRFEREAKILSEMTHLNIVSVYRFAHLTDGTPFLEMEYVAGESLRSLLEREAPLACAQAVTIAIQIVMALKHAHSCHVVHRDLKPENILICKQSDKELIAKLADFGLSKQHEANLVSAPESTLTDAGELIGTPNYMSPELCLGKGAVWQSDMYALGCVLYEMLSGIAPFEGNSLAQTISNHVLEETPKLRNLPGSSELPEQIDKIIATCTEKNPESRYRTYDELLSQLCYPELRENQSKLPGCDEKTKPKQKKKANVFSLILGFFVIALVLLSNYLSQSIKSGNSALISAQSCLAEIKKELSAGKKGAAKELFAEFLQKPSCKKRELADFSMASLEEFRKVGDLDNAELCAISAISALTDECKERLQENKAPGEQVLTQLDKLSSFLLVNTKQRKDWSKLYSILSTRTELRVPGKSMTDTHSDQQVFAGISSIEIPKLWFEAALRKGRPTAETVDQMSSLAFDIYEKSKKRKLDLDMEYYFKFLRVQIPKFDISMRECELHLYESAFYKDRGDGPRAQEALLKYEAVANSISPNTAEFEMNRLRELQSRLLSH